MNSPSKKYFFCGVGGNGMSPLARLLAARGMRVFGSDRSNDRGTNVPFFERLRGEGITLVPQDGSGVTSDIDAFVVTRAVEDSIPDIQRAKELGIPIVRRPELMRDLFADSENVMVGGTSGKSTTAGMIGFILHLLDVKPTVVNGAVMKDFDSNFVEGNHRLAVFEADESDGLNDVIALCRPTVSVLTNISLDHFELSELEEIFTPFISTASKGAVLNAECPISMRLKEKNPRVVTFALSGKADFTPETVLVDLQILGDHNVANGLAAIAACSLLGIEPAHAARSLQSFTGIKRRLERVGEARGVTVIDDFASNPAKIEAGLATLTEKFGRLFVVFQPHGFAPTKMMKDGYIKTFSTRLRQDDVLILPDIYYAGGSANIVAGQVVELPKDISSRDVVDGVRPDHPEAHYIPRRSDIVPFITERAREGDCVVVMGSRDETLSDFAEEVVKALGR